MILKRNILNSRQSFTKVKSAC